MPADMLLARKTADLLNEMLGCDRDATVKLLLTEVGCDASLGNCGGVQPRRRLNPVTDMPSYGLNALGILNGLIGLADMETPVIVPVYEAGSRQIIRFDMHNHPEPLGGITTEFEIGHKRPPAVQLLISQLGQQIADRCAGYIGQPVSRELARRMSQAAAEAVQGMAPQTTVEMLPSEGDRIRFRVHVPAHILEALPCPSESTSSEPATTESPSEASSSSSTPGTPTP